MNPIVALVGNPWVFWSLIGIAAVFGALAVFFPEHFRRWALLAGTWIDTSRLWAVFDRRIEVDSLFLRYPRAFGAMILAGALLGAALYWRR